MCVCIFQRFPLSVCADWIIRAEVQVETMEVWTEFCYQRQPNVGKFGEMPPTVFLCVFFLARLRPSQCSGNTVPGPASFVAGEEWRPWPPCSLLVWR